MSQTSSTRSIPTPTSRCALRLSPGPKHCVPYRMRRRLLSLLDLPTCYRPGCRCFSIVLLFILALQSAAVLIKKFVLHRGHACSTRRASLVSPAILVCVVPRRARRARRGYCLSVTDAMGKMCTPLGTMLRSVSWYSFIHFLTAVHLE